MSLCFYISNQKMDIITLTTHKFYDIIFVNIRSWCNFADFYKNNWRFCVLYSFDECIKKYNNLYQIEKMIQSEKLYKIDRGIYSDKKQVTELEVIAFKYPNAVFAMDSAFYYQGLTDVS